MAKMTLLIIVFFSNALASIYQPQSGLYRSSITIDRVLPENASIFSTAKLPSNKNLMATIGNGYVAQQVASDTIYISGVYNGNDAYQSKNVAHRARIPSTNSISISFPRHTVNEYYTLDINDAVYFNSYLSTSNIFQVEQLTFAPRPDSFRNMLATQIFINNSLNTESLTINLANNAGSKSNDISFSTINCANGAPANVTCQTGTTLLSEANYSKITVGIMNTNIPSSITIPAKTVITYYFASVFLTSLEVPATSITAYMVTLYNSIYVQKEFWLEEHLNEWADIWNNGRIDIIGDDNQAGNVYASLYYTISSIRDDWSHGLSPGSLSSDGYNGHVFWFVCI